MKHLSLFSGIGGIDLAAEQVGFQTVAFCEQDRFCQKVLAKHWPGVPIYDDVKTLTVKSLRDRRIKPGTIKLISGGFPCQDISLAGNLAGLEGERSGLWFEYFRLIRQIRPDYVLVENVSALLLSIEGRPAPIATVLGNLASIRYDAEWFSVSAADVGAPHTRQRVFIVAYPDKVSRQKGMGHIQNRAKTLFRKAYKERSGIWLQTPDQSNRVDDGVSEGLYKDRVGALGNAVVPAQVYPILKAIADYEAEQAA